MKARIQTLALTSFRGATQPVEIIFDTTKPVSLIFGDNATGKSTLIDGIDFVCNGKFGSLDDHSMASQPKSHVASLGHDPKKLRVELVAPSGKFAATLTKTGPTIIPPKGCPQARILRRSKILTLLDAEPRERFNALKSYIAVPGIEKSEEALRAICKTIQEDFDESTRAYQQADTELERLWNAEGKVGESALSWAALEAAKDLSALQATVGTIDSFTTALTAAESALTTLDDALAKLAPAQTSRQEAQAELERIEAAQTQGSASLVDLLEDAKKYAMGHKTEVACPVCEQRIGSEDLIARLEIRIAGMTELATASGKVASALSFEQSKQALVTQNQTAFILKTKALGVLAKASNLEEVVHLAISWADFETLLTATAPTRDLEAKGRELISLVSACRVPLGTRKENDQKSINQHNAIKGHHDTHTQMLKSASDLEILSGKMAGALVIVTKERKSYVEGILGAICGEVEKLYVKIHPGEDIGKIKFFLKPNTIGSLEFNAQFKTEASVPPQAYYSESHLDTLGICVFLALTKYFMTEDTIVVLDDVVTSVDGPHLDRFMEMLHDEAPNFNHVIVSTHYRAWKDRYRNARGPAAKTQVLELRQWSLDMGVQADEAVTATKELRACLAAPKMDRQAVASKAGIQLESILDFLTYQYECKMPRQSDPNYTLGALGQGIDSKLGKILKTMRPGADGQPKIETPLKALIDELTNKGWVRNRAGCHFNSLGSDISDAEIKDFGTKVLALADALICQGCETLPSKRPGGSFWQCGCGKIELHPLIQPGAPLGSVKEEIV